MRRADRGCRAVAPCIALWVLLLTGCEGNYDAASSDDGGNGGGGSGGSGTLAVNTLIDTGPTSAGIDDRSGDLLLTRLSVTLTRDATRGQLDAAMAAVGSTGIGFATSGSPYLTLIVPRQENGAKLAALAQLLQSQPGILFAAPGRQMSGFILPGQAVDSPQSPDLLGHLLPSRFPAAWNAAFDATGQRLPTVPDCAGTEATLVLVDFFQTKPPDPNDQLAPFIGARAFGAFDEGPDDHGWQVAATLASMFDELMPTGALPLPDCVDFVLVDISGLTYAEIIASMQQAIQAQPPAVHLVANLSFGFGRKFCGPNVDAVCTEQQTAATPAIALEKEMESRVLAAIQWAEFSDDALDERMLLVQAAGNEAAELQENGGLGVRYTGIRQADLASPIALATRLGSLNQLFSPESALAVSYWTSAGRPSLLLSPASFQQLQAQFALRATRVPTKANVILVGSATHPESGFPGDSTESSFSNEGSALLAVGENVVGLGTGSLPPGTSFAAPQVTGLAAYLWSISDLEDRPASETATHIKFTTSPTFLLDAYAATLALDVVPTMGTVGIREALLDVNGDDVFDERDLQEYETAYGLDDPNTPSIPETRDYSRFDLNGDGATGGISTYHFDLDRSSVIPGPASVYDAVDRAIEGYTISFNESAVSDIQVLCYYAYSTLYADDNPGQAQEEARTAILGPDRCVFARMYASFPAQIAGATPLGVKVELPVDSGQYAPAPNMLVSFSPSCGSVSPTSGRTDAEGNISTTVTPTDCPESVSVTAVARAEEGTTVLARETVTARVSTIVFGENIVLCRQSMIDAFNASGIGTVVGNLSIQLDDRCNEEDEGPVVETALDVSLPGLVRVGGHLDISGPVTGISLSALTEAGGNFGLSGISGSTSPSLPALQRVLGSLGFSGNTGLSSANLPQLEYVGDSLFVDQNTDMTSASFPRLARVFTGYLNRGGIFIDENPGLNQLEIGPALITTSSGGLFITDNATLSSLADVSCDIKGGGLWITGNSSLSREEVDRYTDCFND